MNAKHKLTMPKNIMNHQLHRESHYHKILKTMPKNIFNLSKTTPLILLKLTKEVDD